MIISLSALPKTYSIALLVKKEFGFYNAFLISSDTYCFFDVLSNTFYG